MQINKVYVGNNLDVLKTFPDNSVDSIVTDPPYGLGKEPNANELLKDWLEHGYHEIKGKGFMGKEWDAFVPQPILWEECLRVLKPGGHLLSFAGTRTYDWVVMGLRLAGFEIRDQLAWIYGSGFPKSLDISKAIDKSMGAEREVVGKDSRTAKPENTTVNMGIGFGKWDITTPSTEEAKQWSGWGTALKPALEPIVMARKPLEGTVANNVLKHGVGGINIDGCRVETDDDIGKRYDSDFQSGNSQFVSETAKKDGQRMVINKPTSTNLGRLPANVIHDGSDEVVSLFPSDGVDSSARFFYTAKASQSERNFGLYNINDKKRNIHPTVKPIDLMQYLVRLVTPKGGICLDPYLGSGTTAIACKSEKINYIGIELEPEYAKIAEARIKAETVQYDIFDFLGDE